MENGVPDDDTPTVCLFETASEGIQLSFLLLSPILLKLSPVPKLFFVVTKVVVLGLQQTFRL